MYRPVEMESRSLRMVVNIVGLWRKKSRRNVKSQRKRPISSRLISSPNPSQTSKWQNNLGISRGILEKKKKKREEKLGNNRTKAREGNLRSRNSLFVSNTNRDVHIE